MYKSYNRAWFLFTAFAKHYVIYLGGLQPQHMMELISYLSLAGFAPATIHLYVAGVRTHLKWRSLLTFRDSFVIKMMLKGVSSQHITPDIHLPVTRNILHQMCTALQFVVNDRYLVAMFKSMLTLAFNGKEGSCVGLGSVPL